MKYINNTNQFFKKKIYNGLVEFAFSPMSWVFAPKKSSGIIPVPNYNALIAGFFLAPILSPVTIVTGAIAICLAAITAILHGLTLIVAGLIDTASKTNVTLLSEPDGDIVFALS